ncbi:uncharacterized protein V6R79_015556 [Siganus canaliculatus]
MKSLRTLNLSPILALASLFINISASISLHPVLTGPDMAYLGSRAAYRCVAPDPPLPVTYQLIKDGDIPIASSTIHLKVDKQVPFLLKVTAASEGSYQCKATAGGSTGVSNSIKLTVVTPPLTPRVTSDYFPPVAYEGSTFILNCNVSKGSHLSYTWFFNRKEVTSSDSPFFHLVGNTLLMEKVTPEHAGVYSCMAWSNVQDIRRFSSSPEVQVTVKVPVSKPKISFSISKVGNSYRGNVTCWSTRGSLPVNFSLSLDDKEVGSVTATESLTAWFHVDLVPGLDMGEARCRVNTEVQVQRSEPVTLEVVPVGGSVKVEVEYLYRADSALSAAKLSCHISRGTFVYVSWLFNDSVLPSETHEGSHLEPVLFHYSVAHDRRTLFLAKLGPEESGLYRCRARDLYDDSGAWVESAAVLVRATDRILNAMSRATSSTETPPKVLMNTTEVIAITFCCFLLLVLATSVICVNRMFDRQQGHTYTAATSPASDEFHLSALTSQSAETFSID